MPRQTTEIIFLHCSATKPSMDTDIKDIDRWHRERGFLKVGYHFVIKRDGTTQIGRDLMEAGAHVKSYNHKSIGICLIGGVAEIDVKKPEFNFTTEQIAALKSLLITLKEKFPDVRIMGHNEVSSKACPSFDVQKWLLENDFVKPAEITTPREKEILEKYREKLRKEQRELFPATNKE